MGEQIIMENSNKELIGRIQNLKIKKNAIILAHNYQPGEVQDIADFTGDSLELSRKTAESDAQVVVVCGVDFVAETVSILNPGKTILLPEKKADCPLAGMITAERLREKKKEFPGAKVVCYLRSSAEVKAESDICCTADNAVAIVEKFEESGDIIFIPDQYLGDYVCTLTGREMILWPGYCPSHNKISSEDITRQKEQHPHARVVVHPQCTPQVRALADAVLSISGIVRFARETSGDEVIVGTETGILHRLQKENPGKIFIPASEKASCGKMKLITLEVILWSLENMTYRIQIPEDIRLKAKGSIDRMTEAGF
jgi:quinolinate synthase